MCQYTCIRVTSTFTYRRTQLHLTGHYSQSIHHIYSHVENTRSRQGRQMETDDYTILWLQKISLFFNTLKKTQITHDFLSFHRLVVLNFLNYFSSILLTIECPTELPTYFTYLTFSAWGPSDVRF